MAYNNVYRALRGRIKRDTGKAILLVVRDPEALTPEEEVQEQWIPTSQIKSIHNLKDDFGESIVMASEWILKQKDWLHLSTANNPALQNTTPISSHPKVPDTPPAKSFVDMDDDIPF